MITKAELKRYPHLLDEKAEYEKEIEMLRDLEDCISGISYDGVRVQSHYSGSAQEQFLEKISWLIERYQQKIFEIIELKEKVENEVSELSDEEALLIRLRYFNDLSCEQCAKKLYISLRSFHRMHSEILTKLKNN